MSDSKNPVIEFYPWEYRLASQVGTARFVANWGRANASHYDEDKMEVDRKAQPAAVLCEIAVARYTNQYCHCHAWHWSEQEKYDHIPDVGNDIEVRRSVMGRAVAVRRKDAGKIVWGVHLLDAEYRTAEIMGYISADETIKSLKGTFQNKKYVSVYALKKPWESAE